MKKRTTIFLDETLLKKLDVLAQEMNISRAQLISLPVEQFIARHENNNLVEKLIEVYQDGPDTEDQKLLREAKSKFRLLLKND